MEKSEAVNLLEQLVERLINLDDENILSPKFQKWHRDTRVALQYIFGENSSHLKDFEDVDFIVYALGATEIEQVKAFNEGRLRAQAILYSMIEEIAHYWKEEAMTMTSEAASTEEQQAIKRNVFVVHGRNSQVRDS